MPLRIRDARASAAQQKNYMTSHNIAAGCAAKGSLRVPIIAVCNNLLARAHDTGSGLRVFIPLWSSLNCIPLNYSSGCYNFMNFKAF